jgi:hypothetical protein
MDALFCSMLMDSMILFYKFQWSEVPNVCINVFKVLFKLLKSTMFFNLGSYNFIFLVKIIKVSYKKLQKYKSSENAFSKSLLKIVNPLFQG